MVLDKVDMEGDLVREPLTTQHAETVGAVHEGVVAVRAGYEGVVVEALLEHVAVVADHVSLQPLDAFESAVADRAYLGIVAEVSSARITEVQSLKGLLFLKERWMIPQVLGLGSLFVDSVGVLFVNF